MSVCSFLLRQVPVAASAIATCRPRQWPSVPLRRPTGSSVPHLPLLLWLCPSAASGVQVSLCVEDRDNIKALAAEAARQGTHVDVLVEVNVGQNR